MTIEQLKCIHRARPFQAFTLYLADGRELHVPHNDFLLIRNNDSVTVHLGDDDLEIVALKEITRIELDGGATVLSEDAEEQQQ